MNARTGILIAGVALALVIVAQNTDVVTLRFLLWEWRVSQVIVIPLIFLAGGAAGAAAALLGRRR